MANIYELENLLNDPDYFLDEYFSKVRNKIDLWAEEENLASNGEHENEINMKRAQLFKELDTHHVSCKSAKLIFSDEIKEIKKFVAKYDIKLREVELDKKLELNISQLKQILLFFHEYTFEADEMVIIKNFNFDGHLNKSVMKVFDPNYLDTREIDLFGQGVISIENPTFVGGYKLKKLILHNNRLTTLEKDAFADLLSLEDLDMSSNDLTSLSPATFRSLKRLRRLNLGQNQLESLEDDTFTNLVELDFLSLSINLISTLNKNTFNNLMNLTTLDLSANKLTLIGNKFFVKLVNLKKLDLSCNPGLVTIQSLAFNGLTNLEELYLFKCAITILYPRLFDGLNKLTRLNLRHNDIASLEQPLFQNLKKLQYLDLRDNPIDGLLEPNRKTLQPLINSTVSPRKKKLQHLLYEFNRTP